jgi:hypothetical protein
VVVLNSWGHNRLTPQIQNDHELGVTVFSREIRIAESCYLMSTKAVHDNKSPKSLL